jgi:hypothetical protein
MKRDKKDTSQGPTPRAGLLEQLMTDLHALTAFVRIKNQKAISYEKVVKRLSKK